jgi:hypothetical protein
VNRRLLLCLGTLPFAAAAAAQTVDELVARLAQAGSYDDAMVGDDGARTSTYADYASLAAIATAERLQKLAEHDSPVVRCYAVRALAERGETRTLPAILRAHSADVTKVAHRSGCEVLDTTAGELMFDIARSRLTAEELLDLAEHYVRTSSPLHAREWCLRTLRFRDGMLHAIRKLAADGDAPALVALVRYGVPTDVPLLLESLKRPDPFDDNCHFLAAEVSRDPRLLPALAAIAPAARRRLQNDNAWRLHFWLEAITAQGSDDAAKVLAGFVDECGVTGDRRQQLLETVRSAIEAHPAPAFAELLQRLPARDRKQG